MKMHILMVDGRVLRNTGAALLKARAPHRVVVLDSSIAGAHLPISVPELARMLAGGLQCTQEQVRLVPCTPG